ncbi:MULTISPECIES: sulfatase family protein [Sphingobacterium]|uniref:sulfatase family protein n=1 Tax=Sphingobacterium TaxID=28453 RepID=UPI0013DA1402|nr:MULTISPECIES: arylsulfatase [unclassified Sphingobacterium]
MSFVLHAHSQSKPNIIFILADDLGYGDLRSFNPEGKIPTPNLDKLASRGMRFTNAHASSAVCTPSRYSIITGRYPWRSKLQKGVLFGFDAPLIEPDRTTVASFLQDNGYFTTAIGKWHLGLEWAITDSTRTDGWGIDYTKPIKGGPNTLGFNYFYGISASLDMPPFIFIENEYTLGVPTVTKKWVREGPAEKDFEAQKVLASITHKAQQVIYNQVKEQKPFFMYIALTSPHTPILPTEKFKGKSGVTDYGDFVMETDWAVGQVMKTLDSLGVADNTLVFFTSDNGFAPYVLRTHNVESLGHYPSNNLRGYKADVWDGGHRVPLIVSWPDQVKGGSVNHSVISLTDFMATCADILNKKLPEDAAEDSYSLLPYLLSASDKAVRAAVVAQSHDGNFSIQQGKWKLILGPGSGGWAAPKNEEAYRQGLPSVQLYDMVSDISEKKNLAYRHPEVVTDLMKLLEQYVAQGRSTPGKPLQNAVQVDIWKK